MHTYHSLSYTTIDLEGCEEQILDIRALLNGPGVLFCAVLRARIRISTGRRRLAPAHRQQDEKDVGGQTVRALGYTGSAPCPIRTGSDFPVSGAVADAAEWLGVRANR